MSFIDHFSEKSDLYASARPTYPDELFVILAHVHTWSATRLCMNERGADFFERAGERLFAA